MSYRFQILLSYLTVFCTLILPASAHAQAPALLPIQGYLTSSDGTLLSDGSYTIRFRLYDNADPAELTALHDETLDVQIVGGYFTIYLGDTDNGGSTLNLSLFRNISIVFLGIKVGADEEAVPRLQLATAAFAAVANYCGDADTLGGQDATAFAEAGHTHAYSQLNSVPADFADGVDNDTTYAAGTGIAIASNQIAVSFGGGGSATTVARSDHSHTETDPQVGTLITNNLPRWNGSALVTGSVSDTGSVVSYSGALDLGLHRVSCVAPVGTTPFTLDCPCPSGEVAISGGAWPENGVGHVRESYPTGNGWRAGCDTDSGATSRCGAVYALCASVTEY